MHKILAFISFSFFFLFLVPIFSPAHAESLYVRTNKSYVEPGSFYNLTVLSSRVPFTGYTGLLDVNVTNCAESGTCNTTTGPWGNYQVQGGSIRIDIATNYAPSYFRARFKPRNSAWDWSNEIQIDISMTQGLENAQNYWLLPSTPVEYTGTNFADNKNFKTVIGYNLRSALWRNIPDYVFYENDPSGYWDPTSHGTTPSGFWL
jgi:hypothetical protein